jgi:hypothetical protein
MNDFDFLAGTWSVRNRRQDKWLVGSTTYEEFPGTARAHRFWNGSASVDEIEFPTLGSSGATMRTYDPERDEWSLYWFSSRRPGVEPPVIGRFAGGVGVFVGDDEYEGRPIRVRFTWSGITATTAHWQQELSDDGGQTWELNWTMDFTRVS